MTRTEAVKEFFKKAVLPVAIAGLLYCIFKSACIRNGELDLLWLWILCGLPFGIHRMCVWIVPGGDSLGGGAALFVLNFVIGGIMLYYASLPKTEDEALALTQLQKTINLLIPLLGAVCAVTLVAFARKCLRHEKPSPLLYMIVSIYLVVRLIVNFQKWSTDPSLNDFVYHLFAAISCMLAAFQLAGFSFGKGKRHITLFWSLCAVYFSAISVIDCLCGRANDAGIQVALLLTMAASSLQLLCNPAQNEPEEKTI